MAKPMTMPMILPTGGFLLVISMPAPFIKLGQIEDAAELRLQGPDG
jgi:hypothetical protein